MNAQSRRSFLQYLGLGAAATALGFSAESFTTNTKQKKKLGVALVGLGSYSKYRLAVGLQQANNCYLAGIVTGTPSKAVEWKNQYNLPDKNIYNYQNFDQIANNPDIDIVYVVLPNSMHHEFVIRAAKAGKHVMCEKPMAISVQQCEEMIKACRDAGVQLGIGYRLHFEPFNKEMMRLGQNKVLGDVRSMNTSFGFTIGDPSQWRLKKQLAGGGPLMDLGIYCVQAARYVTGKEPIWVTAEYGPVTDKEKFRDVEESISWQMEFPEGVMAKGFSSYDSNVEQLYVTTENGWMKLSPAFGYGPLQGSTSGGALNLPVVHHQTAMLQGICDEFLQSKTFPKHISGEEGLRDLRILMSIYEAAQSGKKIQLKA